MAGVLLLRWLIQTGETVLLKKWRERWISLNGADGSSVLRRKGASTIVLVNYSGWLFVLLLDLIELYVLAGQSTGRDRLLRVTALAFLDISPFLVLRSFMALFLVLVVFRHLLQMLQLIILLLGTRVLFGLAHLIEIHFPRSWSHLRRLEKHACRVCSKSRGIRICHGGIDARQLVICTNVIFVGLRQMTSSAGSFDNP